MTTRLVWTSDPAEARRLREEGKIDTPEDTDVSKQKIRVVADRKRRAGKTVTVASGFVHSAESLARLAANLKKKVGAGGTVKDNEIEIQGDHVTSVAAELKKLGYRVTP